MRFARSLSVLSRLMAPRVLQSLTWGNIDLPQSGDLDTASVVFRAPSGVTFRGTGRDTFLALHALKQWGGRSRPQPDTPLVVASPTSEHPATRTWIEALAHLAVEGDGPEDAHVVATRTYTHWLSTTSHFNLARAEREGLMVLTWLMEGPDGDPLDRAVEERWTAWQAGADAPEIRRGPRALGSLGSDPPLLRLLPGFGVSLGAGEVLYPPPAPSTAQSYLYTVRLLLNGTGFDPTEDRLVLAALLNFGKLRSPQEAWSAFRVYTGKRGLDLPEYPSARIASERHKRHPSRSRTMRIEPSDFMPPDVVRAIYDLFGDRKIAYQGIPHLRRSDVKEESGQVMLPERWKDGGWLRWRPLNASERLGLHVLLAWSATDDRVGEDDPLIPVAPGSPAPATHALILGALAHHGYNIGKR